MTVRVLVVDDHPVFRKGLRGAIDAAAGAEWVGEAVDGDDAVALAAQLAPDVVLMDLRMDRLSGVEATRQILERAPETKVLVLTMSDDDESVFAAVRAGARGYLLKGAGEEAVAAAVEAVARGEAVFGSGVAARLLDHLGGRRHSADPFPELSPRERQVLGMVAAGLGNVAIADSLAVAPKTVRNQVSTILTKIGASDRADAVRRARAAGLA